MLESQQALSSRVNSRLSFTFMIRGALPPHPLPPTARGPLQPPPLLEGVGVVLGAAEAVVVMEWGLGGLHYSQFPLCLTLLEYEV